MKKLFKVLYALRYVVLVIVLAIAVVIGINIWALIDGGGDILLTLYLLVEFAAGIAYLIIIPYVKRTYDKAYPPAPKKAKPFNQAKARTVRKTQPASDTAQETNDATEEVRKAVTADDVKITIKTAMFQTTVLDKVYQYRIYSDGRVYNMQTRKFIGYKSGNRHIFEINRGGVRERFVIEELVKQLF